MKERPLRVQLHGNTKETLIGLSEQLGMTITETVTYLLSHYQLTEAKDEHNAKIRHSI